MTPTAPSRFCCIGARVGLLGALVGSLAAGCGEDGPAGAGTESGATEAGTTAESTGATGAATGAATSTPGTAGSSGTTSGSGTTGTTTGDPTTSASATATGTTTGSATTGTDGTGSSTTGASTTGSTTTGEPTGEVVRFFALGDQGKGNDNQRAVGAAVARVCAERGCDFGLLLGDNFYDNGVTSAIDSQFVSKFEEPYADVDVPFYVVMGNHDYGETSAQFQLGENQRLYAAANDKFRMPDAGFWYDFRAPTNPDVHLVAFDTARMIWGVDVEPQQAFVEEVLAATTARWRIAFAHHPYVSNGAHGNAGTYEGIPFVPVLSGGTIKDFFDESICGRVDLYLSGHDHNRQAFSPPASCATHFIVSGAGGGSSSFEDRGANDDWLLWGDDAKAGFVWIEIDGDVLTAAHYDRDGAIDFEHELRK